MYQGVVLPTVNPSLQAHAERLLAMHGERYRVSVLMHAHELKNGQRWYWYYGGSAVHHLRTVLPNEMVFDVGDTSLWHDTVRFTDVLCRALDSYYCDYWVALSGGRGVHIHVFGPKHGGKERLCSGCSHAAHDTPDGLGICNEMLLDDSVCKCDAWMAHPTEWRLVHRHEVLTIDHDWRGPAASAIVTRAQDMLGKDSWLYDPLDVDVRCLMPNESTRQVREFGAMKEAGRVTRKTLWHETVSGRPCPTLPPRMLDAYAKVGLAFPSSVPTNPNLNLLDPKQRWNKDVEWTALP